MKKHSLLKVLGITFLFTVVLTWIIATGNYQEGEFVISKTNPLGFLDIVRTPLSTIANFIHYGIAILVIGGFYGVINKTGAYSKIVQKLSTRFNSSLLIFTMIFFILLSSLVGINMLLFVLVPFFATLLLLTGKSKITALSATVGSILVGGLGATYSSYINTPLKYFFENTIHNEIFTKVIFLAIISFLFIIFVNNNVDKDNPKKEKNKKEEKIEIPLYTNEVNEKRSIWPLVSVIILSLLFLLVAMYDWFYSFNITIFQDIHTAFNEMAIDGYPLFANLVGGSARLGSWSIYDLSIFLVIISGLIGWLYSIKLNDVVEAFVDGAKKMLKPAIYVMLANIVFAVVYVIQGSNNNIFFTISDFFLNITEEFSLISTIILSSIGSFFFNDFYQFSSVLTTVIQTNITNDLLYPVIAIVMQFVYGIMMLILPTSLILVAGLSYLEINYKEWIKYIWKYVIQISIISIIIIFIVKAFI